MHAGDREVQAAVRVRDEPSLGVAATRLDIRGQPIHFVIASGVISSS